MYKQNKTIQKMINYDRFTKDSIKPQFKLPTNS